MAKLEVLSEHRSFGGTQRFYRHDSVVIGLPMKFSVFTPDGLKGAAPALFYLAGLTCTEETFMMKAGAQRVAAELGMVLIAPDTSPRGANVPGENDSWEWGTGAGFYVDATCDPWRQHYCMYSYVVDEMVGIACDRLAVDPARIGIFGHSMGGHGALVMALRNPDKFRSVSAFAPVAAPSRSPWGQQAFSRYLGTDVKSWSAYDASLLMAASVTPPFPRGILVDQGLADGFLTEQLFPDAFEAACAGAAQPLQCRRHDGYDHGYYFISTFIEDHLRFHADCLSV
jgi:S-formylglutathione hydrolase